MSDHETEGYENRPNAEAYAAVDAINAARDKLVAALEDFAHCQVQLHAMGQSEEWRRHNLTNMHLLELHKIVGEANQLSHEAHLKTLAALRMGHKTLGQAFSFSHASEPRVANEGGCDC